MRYEYRFDALKNQLVVVNINLIPQRSRLLLDHVETWDCRIDLDHHWFDVSIQLMDGISLARRYELP